MSTINRICETCVYCSFAGNCDRYDKPLTSIEQSACDAYEIHPLLAENAKLKRDLEILRDYGIEIVDAEAGGFEIYSKDHALADKLKGLVGQYHSAMQCMLETGIWPTDPAWLEDRMRELGIEAK